MLTYEPKVFYLIDPFSGAEAEWRPVGKAQQAGCGVCQQCTLTFSPG